MWGWVAISLRITTYPVFRLSWFLLRLKKTLSTIICGFTYFIFLSNSTEVKAIEVTNRTTVKIGIFNFFIINTVTSFPCQRQRAYIYIYCKYVNKLMSFTRNLLQVIEFLSHRSTCIICQRIHYETWCKHISQFYNFS